MRISDVQIKKLRAVCDLLEASPNGPNNLDQKLAAGVVEDCARMLNSAAVDINDDASKAPVT